MSDQSGGFVHIYRRVLDNPVFKSDAEALAFVWLIMKAAWKPTVTRYKGRLITLNRGQVAVSVRDLSDRLEWSKSRVSRFLNTLQERDMIGTDDGTGVNVITLRKYGDYQLSTGDAGTPPATEVGQERDSSGTQNKEEKELKEKNHHDGLAFAGRVIRLRQSDFDRWQSTYSCLDLPAALQSRDDWLAEDADPETRKRWFVSTSNWLAGKAQKAARDAQPTAEGFWV